MSLDLRLDSHQKAERVRAMRLTKLNLETTLRWQACVDAGTHCAGLGQTIIRPIKGYWETFAICDSCGVPVAPAVSWRIRRPMEDVA